MSPKPFAFKLGLESSKDGLNLRKFLPRFDVVFPLLSLSRVIEV